MSFSIELLCRRFPRLYHMADENSWPSIEKHGLLSTSALLDLFEVPGYARKLIEECHRPESIRLHHPVHGTAIIRDQKPMSDEGLTRCLNGKLTPSEWYRLLNGKVFFWLTHERLMRLARAKPYRNHRHCILTIDTARLLKRYADRVTLSPINSGCTKPYPATRGQDTFLPIAKYPFAHWEKQRRKKDPIVELAVQYSVPNLREMITNREYIIASK